MEGRWRDQHEEAVAAAAGAGRERWQGGDASDGGNRRGKAGAGGNGKGRVCDHSGNRCGVGFHWRWGYWGGGFTPLSPPCQHRVNTVPLPLRRRGWKARRGAEAYGADIG